MEQLQHLAEGTSTWVFLFQPATPILVTYGHPEDTCGHLGSTFMALLVFYPWTDQTYSSILTPFVLVQNNLKDYLSHNLQNKNHF
jgi:hypothetical protein